MVKRWLAKITTWSESLTKKSAQEYELGEFTLPEFYKWKDAHNALLLEYAHALTGVARLSFFVGRQEISLPRETSYRGLLFNPFLRKYSPLRLFTIRPLVEVLIKSHIYQKMIELEKIYIPLKFITVNNPEKRWYSEWLTKSTQDISDLRKSLNSGKILFDILKYILGGISAIAIWATSSKNVADLLINIITQSITRQSTDILIAIIVIIFMIVYPVIFVYISVAFNVKRSIFLELKNGGINIYALENKLFGILGRNKFKEWPWDLIVEFLYWTLLIYLFSWLAIIFSEALKLSSASQAINCLWCYPAFFGYMIVTQVIITWWKRAILQEM